MPAPSRCTQISPHVEQGVPDVVQLFASDAVPLEFAGSKYQFETVHEAGMTGCEPEAANVFGRGTEHRHSPEGEVQAATAIWSAERVSAAGAYASSEGGGSVCFPHPSRTHASASHSQEIRRMNPLSCGPEPLTPTFSSRPRGHFRRLR